MFYQITFYFSLRQVFKIKVIDLHISKQNTKESFLKRSV